MTAGQDEARALAVALIDRLREGGTDIYEDRYWHWDNEDAISHILSMLSEARDQGAREGGAIHGFVTDIRAATPSPALAPLREAEPRAMPVNRFTGLACDHAYIRRDPHSTAITWVCDLCGNKLAVLSSAQGSTTEGRK